MTTPSRNRRVGLGALLVALAHPVTLDLLRGGQAATALQREAAAPVAYPWAAVAGAGAHVADALVVAVHPSSWPLLAATGEPLLPAFPAVLVVLVATWAMTAPAALAAVRPWWWAALAFSILAAAAFEQGILERPLFGIAVALTVGGIAAATATLASRTRLGTSPVLVLLVAVVSLASLRLLPGWETTSALATAAVAAAPHSAHAHVALAASSASRGDADGELEALRRALTLAPRDVEVRRALGRAYAARGRWSEAERHLTKVAMVRRDDSHLANDAMDAADAAARAGHWLRARVLVARAAESFDQEGTLSGVTPVVATELARRLTMQGKLNAAARVYSEMRGKLTAEGPIGAGVVRQHGVVLAAAGRQPEAVAAFRDALAQDPADADSATELAWLLATSPSLAETPESRAEALEWASRAAQRRPSDPTTLDTLAAAQAAGGDYPAATASAIRALELGRPLGDEEWLGAVTRRLEGYRQGRPYRESSGVTSRENARNTAEDAALH